MKNTTTGKKQRGTTASKSKEPAKRAEKVKEILPSWISEQEIKNARAEAAAVGDWNTTATKKIISYKNYLSMHPHFKGMRAEDWAMCYHIAEKVQEENPGPDSAAFNTSLYTYEIGFADGYKKAMDEIKKQSKE